MSARAEAAGRAAARPTPAIQPTAGVRLQRSCSCGQHTRGEAECAECRKRKLQRRAAGHGGPAVAPPIVHEVIGTPGHALDAGTRAFMEPRFGHDFSRVRVHAGTRAAASARAVGAQAYTVGPHVVFGADQYAPRTVDGQRLLAHELAHVVQQSGAGAGAPLGSLAVEASDAASEQQAEVVSARVADAPGWQQARGAPGSSASVATVGPVLQRRVSPRMPSVRELLSTGLFNDVTDQEAHDVLVILKELAGRSDVDFRDTVAAMDREGLLSRFLAEVSEADRRDELETLRRITNVRVFTREHRQGATTVTTTVTGSCSPERFQQIASATTRAQEWLDRAIAATDAFLAAPAAPGNAATRDALTLHFKSVAPNVVRHVRGRLHHIRTDLTTVDPFTVECHDTWDLECRVNAAYIPGGEPERMVFCTSFFGGREDDRASMIVHESAHTQVGGVHITDRAYRWERLMRSLTTGGTLLTTEEALTNAESYNLFVEHIVSGRRPSMTPARDTWEDCPADWKDLLERAIARAQKANGDARSVLDRLTAADAGRWAAARIALLGGSSQADIDRAKNVYRGADVRLQQSVDFECEPGARGGRCSRFQVYWWATGDFHICPSWRALATEPERVRSLLSGLYGYFDLEGDGAKRTAYARLAVELSTEMRPVPTLGTILGSPAWTSDLVRIQCTPHEPPPPSAHYFESATTHSRLSHELARFEGPDFRSDPMPFRCQVLFAVDTAAEPRPAPFTPPRASVLFEFTSHTGGAGFRSEQRDPRVNYGGAGSGLSTTFPSEFSRTLRGNGPLHMRFELIDRDSGVTRLYEDTIQVETNRLRDIPTPGPTRVV